MKHNAMSESVRRQPMYPGAADPSYFTGKALEILYAILSGSAAAAFMLCLVTMA